jgi:iron complex outermembrane recepter protein
MNPVRTLAAPFLLGLIALPLWSQAPAPTGEETVVLSPFEVSTDGSRRYLATNALSATRVQIAIRDLPQNIQILTREFLDDTASFSMDDIMRYAPGVTAGQNEGAFNIRGFPSLVNLRNGFRQFGGDVQQDSATLDRVEILKGPSAVLYGVTQPGGLINFITKKPLPTARHTLSASAGSYSTLRTVLDSTGPITANKTVLYRLIAAYDARETPRWFEEYETMIVAPSLTFRPFEDTTIGLEFSHEERDNLPAYLWPRKSAPSAAAGNDGHAEISALLPREFNFTGPDTHDRRTTQYGSIEWTQRVGDSWVGRTVVHTQRGDNDKLDVGGGRFANLANTVINRDNYSIIKDTEAWVGQTDWVWSADLKGIQLKTLVGGQYYQDENATWRRNRATSTGAILRRPIDLATLSFSQLDVGVFPNEYTNTASRTRSKATVWGLYLHQRATLLDERLNILGGVRYDDFQNESTNLAASAAGVVTDINGDDLSPQIAASFRVAKALTVYAMYSTAMEPLGGVDGNGNPLKPFTGEGWDVGLKFEVLAGKLSGSLAVFDIDRSNIPRRDPDRNNFLYQGGLENSQGVEAEFFFSPTRNLELVAGYSYVDAMVVSDPQVPDNEGWRLQNVPLHHFTAWGRYGFSEGALSGLRVGAGVVSVSQAYATDGFSNRFYVNPGYTAVDGMVQYDFRAFERPVAAVLNVKNVLDKDYFLGRFRGWAPPLSVIFSLRTEF